MVLQCSLPPSHIVPCPQFIAYSTVYANRTKAHGFVQAHTAWVRQGDCRITDNWRINRLNRSASCAVASLITADIQSSFLTI
jgi:hypothetical protein